MREGYREFIEKVEALCIQHNITLTTLALALDFPEDKFILAAEGKMVIRMSDILAICKYFGITPNDLLC